MKITKDLTKGNIYVNFFLYAIPLIFASLLSQAYDVIDGVIAGKFIGGNVTYVVAVYLLDIAMVTTDLILTIRNAKLDQEREKAL